MRVERVGATLYRCHAWVVLLESHSKAVGVTFCHSLAHNFTHIIHPSLSFPDLSYYLGQTLLDHVECGMGWYLTLSGLDVLIQKCEFPTEPLHEDQMARGI